MAVSQKSSEFGKFLQRLTNESVALVYSYSNTIDKKKTWYDRWRSSVIMYFGEGAEALGLEVRYIDVDTYLLEMATHSVFQNDYIINLHSGLNRISSWPIVSSLASWRNVPSGLCPSDVHITCERKDVTRAIARSLRLKLPAQWGEQPISDDYVIKARDLGMSVGLQRTSDRTVLEEAAARDDNIVEAFVSGFDATVALLANAKGDYTVLGGRLYKPSGPNPLDWMYTESLKNLPLENDQFTGMAVDVDDDLAAELTTLAHKLGRGSVYRADFRVESLPGDEPPPKLTLENSWFLEVTPTPYISAKTDFGVIMRDAISKPSILNELVSEHVESFTDDTAPQAVLVASILYKAAQANAS